jgi:hypothetical protein
MATVRNPAATHNTRNNFLRAAGRIVATLRPSVCFGQNTPRLGLKNSDERAGLDISLVFGSLFSGEFSFIAFLRQFFHARLYARAHAQCRQRPRRFQPQTAADRLKHFVQNRAAMSVSVLHANQFNRFDQLLKSGLTIANNREIKLTCNQRAFMNEKIIVPEGIKLDSAVHDRYEHIIRDF